MKYKLLISDFDGTLGHVPEEIDDGTVKAVKDYIAKGGKFSICSGRSYYSLKRIFDKYGFTGFAIACQGSLIKDVTTGKIILDGGIDKSVALAVADNLEKDGVEYIGYNAESFVYSKESEYVEYYRNILNIEGIKVPDLKEYFKTTSEHIYKINVISTPEKVIDIRDKYKKLFKDKLIINSGSNRLVEFINPRFSKGKALSFLANYYKIPYNEVMAVGDSSNDEELLRGAWHGVAVGDADEELKKIAKEVTVPFKDKPIKYLLEKYDG